MKNFDLALKAIVINSFDLAAYDIETDGLTIAQQAQKVLDCFSSEYDHEYNRRAFPNKQLRIAEWLKGLPTVCTVPFYNGEIIEHGKRIGQIKQNVTEASEQKYIDQWFSLMAWKIIQLSEMKKQAEKSINNFMSKEEL
ncbi:hypothetical protein [Vibrio phage S4-7]|nr:hypothetical protein [Vibrio phage S4-7]